MKIETVIPIPKTQAPGSLNDIRPISMTPLWSKIMEGFIAQYTLLDTKKNWKKNQHGGKSGSSTDHVLVLLWDAVMGSLEGRGKKEKAASTVLCGVDFSKSFSRCSYQEILGAYKGLGATQWVINMHAAFLTGRKMRVKIGNVLSANCEVTGGAVQGSIMGVLDHNAVLETVEDGIDLQTEKYVDDLTLVEPIPQSRPSYVDEDNRRSYNARGS